MTLHGKFEPYRLPLDWAQRRAQVLERDGHRCTVMLSDGTRCPAVASAVDHIVNVRTDGGTHDLDNLRAICTWHHRHKTSAEGNKARTRVSQQYPKERHPGIIYDD